MQETNRSSLKNLEDLLQIKYKDFVLARWEECITKRLQTRLVISFEGGKVTSVQDQAIIAGSSVLDIYSKRVVDWNTIE